ncbi:MAG: diacylglycerol kinase family lipid kinase [Anaerolineales bacterium]|nr:diacylglycerol kinase family lipid kinase [Anaerolineales bacterium]
MKAMVVLNPYANRWYALKNKENVEAALSRHGVAYELQLTDGPNQGIDIAAQAVREGYAPIIAAGGDGTINEVVNGIMQGGASLDADRLPPLGILPLGSVNDLVHNLGLPTTIPEAVEVISRGRTRRMDLGMVNGRYFANNSAIGLEPSITLIQEKITRVRGTLRYLLATLLGVARNPSWEATVAWDGGEYHGPISLVTVGNGPMTGGVFYMTPHADLFDGRLTFVYGYLPTRRQILKALPRTMKPGAGSYVELPAIHEVHADWLRIRTTTPTPLHTDGEIQEHDAQEMEYSIRPGSISVFLG